MKDSPFHHFTTLKNDADALVFLASVLLAGGAAAVLTVRFGWVLGLAATAAVGGLALFSRFPVVGVYAIALFYPFINFQFVYGELNVPYVDIIAALAFAGWFLRHILLWVTLGQPLRWSQFPGFGFFLAFVVASFLSTTNAEIVADSIKYVLRPLSFFYLMFVIFPFNAILDKRVLLRVFWIFYAIGVLTALNGVWGFLQYPGESLLQRRAIPAQIFGMYPYGTSHNLIAEVLISVIPIGLLLVWMTEKQPLRKWVFLGTIFMMGVNLMTFSRTGWVVLVIELFVIGAVLFRNRVKEFAKPMIIMGLVFVPIATYMFAFSSQVFVQSSDENRLLLNKIAYDTWRDFPILGAGPGRFREFVEKNSVYLIEYGDSSEAHGFVQKIAAEEGLLGLSTYVLLLGYVVRYVWRAYQQVPKQTEWKLIMLACLAMAIGAIIFQLFQTNYFVSKLWFPLGLALAAAHLALQEQQKKIL